MAHTNYLQSIFDKGFRNKSINYVLKVLENIEYDAIAFSGMSGALMASIIADRTGSGLIMVRKEMDVSHSTLFIESSSHRKHTCKYVVIDDVISTGKTIKRIIWQVGSNSDLAYKSEMECVGIVLYGAAGLFLSSPPRFIDIGYKVPIYCRKFINNS